MAGNDAPNNVPDPAPQSRSISEIIHRLEGPYLLLFAVSFLVVGGGFTAGLIAMLTAKPELYWGMLAVLFGVVVAVVVIYRSESARPATDKLLQDQKFDIELSAIRRCIDTALAKAHPRFRAEMLQDLREIRARVSHWKDGEFRIRGGNYNRVLLELYEETSNAVFSVVSPGQLEVWHDTIGPRIAKAIEEHKVKATRVFFFETRADITSDHRKIIAEQMKHFVDARIYINDEDYTSENNENTEHDFHIFDKGEVLFITDDSNGDVFAGTLWFNDHDRVGRYDRARELYMKESRLPQEVLGDDFAPSASTTATSAAPSATQLVRAVPSQIESKANGSVMPAPTDSNAG